MRRSAPPFLLGALFVLGCGDRTEIGVDIGPADGSSDVAPVDDAAPNPFLGTWRFTNMDPPLTFEETLTFGPGGGLDGTLSEQGCSGSWSLRGLAWSATSTMLTLTDGALSCSGTLVCQSIPEPCTSGMVSGSAFQCAYAFSDGDHILTLTDCTTNAGAPMGPLVLTRQ